MNYALRTEQMHKASADAGWWPKEVTPELVATKLMLIVTEISEAHEGWHSGAKDQHLPERDSFAVELADARIRIFDLAGQQKIKLTKLDDETFPCGFMHAVDGISEAMEGHRKGNKEALAYGLNKALVIIDTIAAMNDYDIEAITDEKAAYNAIRADHKPAARAAAGGKKL